jgi:hypothetical protein
MSLSMRTLAVSFGLALALASQTVNAAPINYGNLAGTTVLFEDVTEDSATDPLPLYGTPGLSGNGLVFSPTAAFSAKSVNGGAPDLTDGKLTTTISTTGLNRISAVSITEFGDYTLFGGGTASTAATVGAPVFITLLELDGVAVAPVQIYSGNLLIVPSSGTYDLVNDPGIGVLWSGVLSVDVDSALVANSISGRATKVAFRMDNTLTAASEAGALAFIAKKGINGPTVTTTIVPEPSTLVLTGFGIVSVLAIARRRVTC